VGDLFDLDISLIFQPYPQVGSKGFNVFFAESGGNLELLESVDVFFDFQAWRFMIVRSCGGWTRTSDLQVMSSSPDSAHFRSAGC
jgi:hypothetical protein